MGSKGFYLKTSMFSDIFRLLPLTKLYRSHIRGLKDSLLCNIFFLWQNSKIFTKNRRCLKLCFALLQILFLFICQVSNKFFATKKYNARRFSCPMHVKIQSISSVLPMLSLEAQNLQNLLSDRGSSCLHVFRIQSFFCALSGIPLLPS